MMDDSELADLTAQSSSSTGLAARRASIIPASSSDHHQEYWQAAIFKVGDDVRQVCTACIVIICFNGLSR
jgi:hypothetical protein